MRTATQLNEWSTRCGVHRKDSFPDGQIFLSARQRTGQPWKDDEGMFSRGKGVVRGNTNFHSVLIFQDEPNYPSIIRKVNEAPDLGSAEVENFYCSLANPAMVKEMSRVADRSNNHISMKLHRLSWNAIKIAGQPRTSPQDVPILVLVPNEASAAWELSA